MNYRNGLSMALITLILFGVIPLAAAQSPKVKTRSTQNQNQNVQLKVLYGEKETLFVVIREPKGGASVSFKNNYGQSGLRKISKTNFDYVKREIASLPGPTNEKEFCTNRYIEVQMNNRTMLGCLGAPNAVAKKMQNLANLLSLLF